MWRLVLWCDVSWEGMRLRDRTHTPPSSWYQRNSGRAQQSRSKSVTFIHTYVYVYMYICTCMYVCIFLVSIERVLRLARIMSTRQATISWTPRAFLLLLTHWTPFSSIVYYMCTCVLLLVWIYVLIYLYESTFDLNGDEFLFLIWLFVKFKN